MTSANLSKDAARIPVIVGVGEVLDRPELAVQGQEPAELMANALREADRDGGSGWLAQIDSLDIVNSVSWPYQDSLAMLTSRLGVSPARQHYGPIGGESPIRFVHEAALRIASGESQVAAICGGESEHTVRRARKDGVELPWGERSPTWQQPRDRSYLHPLARAHGLSQPIFVYPLYEVACQAAWAQTPAQGHAESAELWSSLSAVAADNPAAFIRRAYTAEELLDISPSNRLIAWPYSKLMVANPVVNQGAAVIVTSLARARAAGVPENRIVHIGPGAVANEPRDWVSRETFNASAAQDYVLDTVLRESELAADQIDFFELYSCFPCVPKMAKRSLGMQDSKPISVTGGLTFFGAPLNNYMTHAVAAMVRKLRGNTSGHGLVYGQGEFVTKHHALLLSGSEGASSRDLGSAAPVAQAHRAGGVPAIVEQASGQVRVETSTVVFDGRGAPTQGVVVVRTAENARTLARVPSQDTASLAVLMGQKASPVGMPGTLRTAPDGLLECSLA